MRSLWALLLLLGVLQGLRATVIEAYSIPTASMEPTLRVGDYVVVGKLAYGAEVPFSRWRLPALRTPQRGDLVVFNPPHAQSMSFVKRVVGLPGDTIRMRSRVLYVNDVAVSEPYVRHDSTPDISTITMNWQREFLAPGVMADLYSPTRDTWGPIVVPAGRYFVLGDNREHSDDSRHWGLVSRSTITGRPLIVIFSLADGVAWWQRILRPL